MARQHLVGLAASATLLCGQCIALVLVRSTVWRRLTSALPHDLPADDSRTAARGAGFTGLLVVFHYEIIFFSF
jgi:hypothetical protein